MTYEQLAQRNETSSANKFIDQKASKLKQTNKDRPRNLCTCRI